MQVESISRRTLLQGLFSSAFVGAAGCVGTSKFVLPRRDDSLVAFLSDCHVGNWKSPKYQGEKFAECLAKVLALDPMPGRIIIPGDLAYLWGRKEDYVLSRELLQPVLGAGIEVTVGMGNHDRRENFLECWPEYANRSPVPGRIVSVVNGKYCDYIVADTLDQPVATDKWITPGVLDDAQREWLGDACRKAKRPFFVVAHHPAIELGATGEKFTYKCAADFAKLIAGPKDEPTKCIGYVHGHDHRWYVTRALARWKTGRVRQTACLPSTGHWGDIGYSLMREEPDRATLSLVQYDYFSPKPLPPGAPARPDWEAQVRDHRGLQCTFVY